jgi:hypothetical protein
LTKIEQVMTHIEYRETKVFDRPEEIQYSDGNISFKGKLLHVNLYDIHNSQDIAQQVISPALQLFRQV